MIKGMTALGGAQPAAKKTEAAKPRQAGRRGDTAGTFRDRSLMSGPMYRGVGQNKNLGV